MIGEITYRLPVQVDTRMLIDEGGRRWLIWGPRRADAVRLDHNALLLISKTKPAFTDLSKLESVTIMKGPATGSVEPGQDRHGLGVEESPLEVFGSKVAVVCFYYKTKVFDDCKVGVIHPDGNLSSVTFRPSLRHAERQAAVGSAQLLIEGAKDSNKGN